MPEQNASSPSSAPMPAVSMKTIPMAGLLCDVYGLEELAAQRTTIAAVSCLWIFHGRGGSKESMSDFANRIVSRRLQQQKQQQQEEGQGQGTAGDCCGGGGRALIAVAFDHRNHGARLVSPIANESWRGGNGAHAVDMHAMISGMVSDTRGLMDVVEGLVKFDLLDGGDTPAGGWTIDQHLVLGKSLGGHSTWQAMFEEERITAGVVIIGCPDYMALMSDRARLSKLSTWSADDNGASFLGSKHFPADLVSACLRHDPKGILFGTGSVPPSSKTMDEAEKQRLRNLLDARVRGKKFLLCSGADDKLVPYAQGKAFVDFFEEAARTWCADAGVRVDNRIYEGVGHEFSEGMVEDSIEFLLDAVASASFADATAASESKPKI